MSGRERISGRSAPVRQLRPAFQIPVDYPAPRGKGSPAIRAEQLIAREPLEPKDIKSMYSYFARHAVDKQGRFWADPARPSAGHIAWLLWGGDEGKTWVDAKRKLLD